MTTNPITIYTIGSSNHPIEEFMSLLRLHAIETIADVRSRPVSRFPHFRQTRLMAVLEGAGVEYLYLGNELGGHPTSDELYGLKGRVMYERLANTPEFSSGIRKVGEVAAKTQLALMCTEGDPAKCHRHPLLAKVLLERGFQVLHILREGGLQEAAALFKQPVSPQMPLIEIPGEDVSWQSPKRIR